jgi:acetoacetate decarboxylase
MDFECAEMTQVADKMIYISPFVKPAFSENPFKAETREIPIDMGYGIDKQYILKLTIPEGYIVETLPEISKIALPNNGGFFTYACSQKGQEISIISKIKVKQVYFKPEEYPVFREFIDLIINKQGEQIVLKKK